MRIGINAQLCSPSSSYRNAGISGYIRGLVTAMAARKDDDRLHVFLPGRLHGEFPNGLDLHWSRWTGSPIARIAWEQMVLPRLARHLRLDVLHSPAYVLPAVCPCPSVVTVLDLSFIRFPSCFPCSQRRYLDYFTRRAVKKADAVIAISEHTKNEIMELLAVPEEKVFTTPLGADPIFSPKSEQSKARIRAKYGLPENIVLFVGTLEPRKNIATLLRAFARLSPDLGCVLVVAGGKGWFYHDAFATIDGLGIGEAVRFLGYVPREDLPSLYAAATVFVYPSLYEGFGLPPLEAMSCGTPVIASNTSSLPEVVGDAGLLVDPHDPQAFAEAITRVIAHEDVQADMRARGIARSSRFSWEETAQRTLNVYHSVHR